MKRFAAVIKTLKRFLFVVLWKLRAIKFIAGKTSRLVYETFELLNPLLFARRRATTVGVLGVQTPALFPRKQKVPFLWRKCKCNAVSMFVEFFLQISYTERKYSVFKISLCEKIYLEGVLGLQT